MRVPKFFKYVKELLMSAGIAQLLAGRIKGPSLNPGRCEIILHVFQTVSVAHPVSYTMGIERYFFGGKVAGA
jgi:hypothetical protein